MRLELGEFPVEDMRFGSHTHYADGVLSINADELRATLLDDPWFEDVSVDLAKPGESIRIHNIVDAVEPRVRVSDPGGDFPGVLSSPRIVGEGRTHRLAGAGIIAVSEPVPGDSSTYWRTAIIDMAGPVAGYSPFGALMNVALTFQPRLDRFPDTAGTNDLNVMSGTPHAMEYAFAVRKAELKAATYVAESVRDQDPADVKVYELELERRNTSLPRVVYLCQAYAIYAYGYLTASVGATEAGPLPTIMHPNEILDGALVNSHTWPACHRDLTYNFQNHPVIEELYRRHGSDLEFGGVVLYTRGASAAAKERMSAYTAHVAKLLGADGAILTGLGSGHSLVDVMMICQKAEQQNIRTTVLLPEMAGGRDDSGLVYHVPEADAMVSTGNYEAEISFPEVSRVIGGDELLETGAPASSPFELPLHTVLASTDPFGSWTVRGQQY